MLSTSYIDSTNANAITGSGTINYGLIVYTNTSSTNNVSTQKALPTQPGGWKLIQTSTASSSASISFTSLGTYTNYMLIWSNVLPASGGGQTLQLQYNQGSGFVTSGYSGSGLFANTAGGPGKITTVTASAVLGDALGNTAPACSGQCLVSNVQFASSTSATFTTSVSNDMGSNGAGIYGGSLGNSAAITQFQVSMASGNIAQGTFSLYGLS